MKKILIVAFHFPPIVTTGTFRTMAWVKRLVSNGWQVHVLTTNRLTDNIEKNYEAALLKKITIYRVNSPDLIFELKKRISRKESYKKQNPEALTKDSQNFSNGSGIPMKEYLTHVLKLPDKYIGWLFSSIPLLFKELRKIKFDVIYSTSPFTTAHLIALVLQFRLKSYWVADFRDPWTDNPFRQFPGKLLNRIDSFLENLVIKTADRIVCVTPNMTKNMKERFPFLKDRIHTITNGYDLKAFEHEKAKRDYKSDDFVIAHAGIFYGPRSPIPVFKALHLISREKNTLPGKIRLLLIGGTNYQGRSMQEICEEYGVSDQVDIIPFIPKKEVIRYLKGADCLLLVGFYGKHQGLQLPGKIFDYIAVGKPIFAIAPGDTQIGSMFTDSSLNGEIADPRDIDQISQKFKILMSRRHQIVEPDPNYEWDHLFSKMEQVLNGEQIS